MISFRESERKKRKNGLDHDGEGEHESQSDEEEHDGNRVASNRIPHRFRLFLELSECEVVRIAEISLRVGMDSLRRRGIQIRQER